MLSVPARAHMIVLGILIDFYSFTTSTVATKSNKRIIFVRQGYSQPKLADRVRHFRCRWSLFSSKRESHRCHVELGHNFFRESCSRSCPGQTSFIFLASWRRARSKRAVGFPPAGHSQPTRNEARSRKREELSASVRGVSASWNSRKRKTKILTKKQWVFKLERGSPATWLISFVGRKNVKIAFYIGYFRIISNYKGTHKTVFFFQNYCSFDFQNFYIIP